MAPQRRLSITNAANCRKSALIGVSIRGAVLFGDLLSLHAELESSRPEAQL